MGRLCKAGVVPEVRSALSIRIRIRPRVTGSRGFHSRENMVISLDCLYFGSYLGPCHMEHVYIIEADGAVSTHDTPPELLGPR